MQEQQLEQVQLVNARCNSCGHDWRAIIFPPLTVVVECPRCFLGTYQEAVIVTEEIEMAQSL